MRELIVINQCGIDTLPVESMGKEVPKGGGDLSDLLKVDTVVVRGGDLSDLLKVDTVVVFSCIVIYNDDPNIYIK
jgi:hypothetical protein